jgi:hypothetical protein
MRITISRVLLLSLVLFIVLFGAGGCAETLKSAGGVTAEAAATSTEAVPATATSTAETTASALEAAGSTLNAALAAGPEGVPETTTSTEVKIGELGERRNPIPLGQAARMGDWQVKVVDAKLNATQLILDENMFNDPPADGSQYVLVSLEATYVGAESSTFWLDLTYNFVGGGGDRFEAGVTVAPEPITDEDEAFPGDTIAGNLVFEVASDQVPGGTLRLKEAFSYDKTCVFFAVE